MMCIEETLYTRSCGLCSSPAKVRKRVDRHGMLGPYALRTVLAPVPSAAYGALCGLVLGVSEVV
jgi:hypothetical protein